MVSKRLWQSFVIQVSGRRHFTAISTIPGTAPPARELRRRRISVRFDRPFGFAAVHRSSGLILEVGPVSHPRKVVADGP